MAIHPRETMTPTIQPLAPIFLTLTLLGIMAGWPGKINGETNLPLENTTPITLPHQLTCPTDISQKLPDPPLNQEELSLPSLWLTKAQFGDRIITHWYIDPDHPSWAILIVNRQIWSLLDYLERYQFVNYFGTIASQYQYNISICHRQKTVPLAFYFCNFNTTPSVCQINVGNQTGFRVR